MTCLFFSLESLRNFLLMDWSAVILVKPVHIRSFLKMEYICKGEISDLTAASMKMTVFWDVAPCSVMEIY
jgi:hypothetical protein